MWRARDSMYAPWNVTQNNENKWPLKRNNQRSLTTPQSGPWSQEPQRAQMEGCQRNRAIRSSSRKINNNNNNKNNNSSNQVHCQGCSHKPWIVSGHKPYIPLNRHFEKLRPRKQKMTRSRGARPIDIVPWKLPSHVLNPINFLTPSCWSMQEDYGESDLMFQRSTRWRPRAAVHARKMTSPSRQENAYRTGTRSAVDLRHQATAGCWRVTPCLENTSCRLLASQSYWNVTSNTRSIKQTRLPTGHTVYRERNCVQR